MKSLWRIAAPVSGVALICGSAIAWHFVAAKISMRPLHYDLRRFASCSRAFESSDGLLIGMAITLALLLWLAGEKTRESQAAMMALRPEPLPRLRM
jgi:hypothetical protein